LFSLKITSYTLNCTPSQAIIDELVAAFPQELLNLPPSAAHAIAPTPEGA
jgi:hypothetical protein